MAESLADIQRQLRDPSVVPGSARERELLEEGRRIKSAETDEFEAVRQGVLGTVASPEGVVPPRGSQKAGEVAMQVVTGQHEVVDQALLAAAREAQAGQPRERRSA